MLANSSNNFNNSLLITEVKSEEFRYLAVVIKPGVNRRCGRVSQFHLRITNSSSTS